MNNKRLIELAFIGLASEVKKNEERYNTVLARFENGTYSWEEAEAKFEILDKRREQFSREHAELEKLIK